MFRGFFLIVSFVGFAAEAELKQIHICLLPTLVGRCRNFTARFSFTPLVDRCEPFIYGGCGGNENNFKTFDDCIARCVRDPDKCSQPIERGPCQDSIIKYGFDTENGKCVEFIYGGCYGNANNFETIEDCVSECG
ncbi:UNVERIFIED_CONTAM: hypothetical protein RMT77_019434 [Armadillidium vulgare]